ncbi:MAG: carboxynorspermidine decarboxylase [Desulfobulbaceae bacterium]|jgi:carboxynorspermidine decarboxylase|nr:carboxynorspermidine decarboxylase [Desulfobulbaceae bacterium]
MTAVNSQDASTLADFPPSITEQLNTPCYLISGVAARRNCRILAEIRQQTGANILLALKAFALPALFPVLHQYLDGVCASGPIEARLGREDFGGEVHTYAPAYHGRQMEQVIRFSDHILFNSLRQWRYHQPAIERATACGKEIRIGLRVNPGYSEVATPLYDPCRPGSRFGLLPHELENADLTGISGLHFHALCEQGADVLARVLAHFEKNFAPWIDQMSWVNFGGGHHISRQNYDTALLCRTINEFRARHNNIKVYLEPGEAVVLNAGVFVTTILDILDRNPPIAILDSSAETHLPDVLAMPYRPHIVGGAEPGILSHTYSFGGISCLAGDMFGYYSFAKPLRIGDRLIMADMALYSFVKNTTFNGVELPEIYLMDEANRPHSARRFGFDDYRGRIA